MLHVALNALCYSSLLARPCLALHSKKKCPKRGPELGAMPADRSAAMQLTWGCLGPVVAPLGLFLSSPTPSCSVLPRGWTRWALELPSNPSNSAILGACTPPSCANGLSPAPHSYTAKATRLPSTQHRPGLPGHQKVQRAPAVPGEHQQTSPGPYPQHPLHSLPRLCSRLPLALREQLQRPGHGALLPAASHLPRRQGAAVPRHQASKELRGEAKGGGRTERDCGERLRGGRGRAEAERRAGLGGLRAPRHGDVLLL